MNNNKWTILWTIKKPIEKTSGKKSDINSTARENRNIEISNIRKFLTKITIVTPQSRTAYSVEPFFGEVFRFSSLSISCDQLRFIAFFQIYHIGRSRYQIQIQKILWLWLLKLRKRVQEYHRCCREKSKSYGTNKFQCALVLPLCCSKCWGKPTFLSGS